VLLGYWELINVYWEQLLKYKYSEKDMDLIAVIAESRLSNGGVLNIVGYETMTFQEQNMLF
jgi:hypothetical protein